LESETAHNVYIVLIIILVAFGSFGLGRLSKIEEGREPVTIEYPTQFQQAGASSAFNYPENSNQQTLETDENASAALTTGNFVASKNGTRYYYPWCSTVKRIKEENKIWFATRGEAESAGYTKALNCKGL